MSGLLTPTSNYDGSLVEAVVMSVDIQRYCCEVKTLNGQKLNGVKWMLTSGGSSRTGAHSSPTVGDEVVVSFSLSYPLIIGYLPKLQDFDLSVPSIDSGSSAVDTGNLSASQNSNTRFNPGKPGDMVPGDHLWTSEGGGMIGLLRHGTVVLRASRLAQIIVSKFDDLTRVISRNLEVFTDVFTDVAYNVKGRIYRFKGYSTTHEKVREDDYTYQEILGDVSLGEYAKQDGFTTGLSGAPVASTTIRKVRVLQGGAPVYEQVLDLDGHKRDEVLSGDGSYIDQTGTTIEIDVGGSSTLTITEPSIIMTHGAGTITMDDSKVSLEFGSHYVIVDATGVHTG